MDVLLTIAGLKIKLSYGIVATKASLESQPEDIGEDVGMTQEMIQE